MLREFAIAVGAFGWGVMLTLIVSAIRRNGKLPIDPHQSPYGDLPATDGMSRG